MKAFDRVDEMGSFDGLNIFGSERGIWKEMRCSNYISGSRQCC